VVVDAGSWHLYKSGVLTKCAGRGTTHAVLVVGYTEEAWIIKNSWGG